MNDASDSLALTRLPHLSLLLAFRTVADQGNFTRAAELLHLSQSAVSQQVVKLEESLGVQLFARSTRAVELTQAGIELLAGIDAPLSQLMAALDRSARRGEPAVLHIEAEPVMSAFWLTPRLKLFTRHFPELRIQQLLTTQRVEFPEQVELAIKWGGPDWPGFDAEFLMGLNYVPVCAPALLTALPPLREPADLARQPLLHDRNQDDWKSWQALHPEIPLRLDRGHVVTDSNVLAQMAIEGYGIALCAVELIERPLRSGELVMPFPDMVMRHPLAYYLLTRRQKPLSDTARRFSDWLKGEAASA
ncbi:LysR family transcriptional regulator [Pseudomonas sp. PDNC002]|uniref:LysR substrate-binding domain-containing protein n=1 Tax=Pseudomonas sp. PDNC002 TaxID=2811422 RepID=UPI001964CCFD|nr:LysR substrate-binding domain-containing protein [Pseudomonas sp. PDNC002]QRY82236.1 LysR family transcriptional regulator [Pseudomonas sp. PDNC002]